ncbi:MAG TPA: GNAT family N-acetyltransferase [Candidatus Saccharimonadales bacterium]|jgi:N-acetylglutamate synthase-like GNAT family acetyltransferase|nr:GNAT family N-acetyltransferase [Candidatus Saccharimonadales bacterium]
MIDGVHFRDFKESDTPVLAELFGAAIRTVYPDISDGVWLNGLRNVEDTYLRYGGAFIVGEYQAEVVAMGELKRISDTSGEMVRVAVKPGLHGAGLGHALLVVIEARAIELGMTELILDTTSEQIRAINLYVNNGYTEYDRKNINHPTGNTFETIYYRKSLQ